MTRKLSERVDRLEGPIKLACKYIVRQFIVAPRDERQEVRRTTIIRGEPTEVEWFNAAGGIADVGS